MNDSTPGDDDPTRRAFLAATALGVGATVSGVYPESATAGEPVVKNSNVKVALKVNGSERTLDLDPRVTLLDALRDHLGLPGSKKGCDHGQCGACTVLIGGRRANSCLTLAVMHAGAEVTTVEGLAAGEELHPLQAAFIKHDAFQCGYCTSGQLCSGVALLAEAKRGCVSHATLDVKKPFAPGDLSELEIRERMSGNLCRCGAYPNIVAAVREVHAQAGK